MTKETVHNELEAKVLIEEAFSQGAEDKYQGTKFYSHKGERLMANEETLRILNALFAACEPK